MTQLQPHNVTAGSAAGPTSGSNEATSASGPAPVARPSAGQASALVALLFAAVLMPGVAVTVCTVQPTSTLSVLLAASVRHHAAADAGRVCLELAARADEYPAAATTPDVAAAGVRFADDAEWRLRSAPLRPELTDLPPPARA
jgi:hypothetical protein